MKDFPLNSRVWVYQSNRVLSASEQAAIQQELDAFVGQWAAHGTALEAKAAIHWDSLIVLMVNEQLEPASGCSIDSSVNFIKELGAKYKFDAFDRNSVAYLKDNKLAYTDLHNLEIAEDAQVFNIGVASLEEFNNSLLLPFSQSPLSRLNIDKSFTFSL